MPDIFSKNYCILITFAALVFWGFLAGGMQGVHKVRMKYLMLDIIKVLTNFYQRLSF